MGDPGPLWHVTLTVRGAAMPCGETRAALERLALERPFFVALRYADDCAQLSYWEEADSLVVAASLAIRLWDQHRRSADLPPWHVVGVEVMEREIYLERGGITASPTLVGAGQVRPF